LQKEDISKESGDCQIEYYGNRINSGTAIAGKQNCTHFDKLNVTVLFAFVITSFFIVQYCIFAALSPVNSKAVIFSGRKFAKSPVTAGSEGGHL
jgi:hypothetical protein